MPPARGLVALSHVRPPFTAWTVHHILAGLATNEGAHKLRPTICSGQPPCPQGHSVDSLMNRILSVHASRRPMGRACA